MHPIADSANLKKPLSWDRGWAGILLIALPMVALGAAPVTPADAPPRPDPGAAPDSVEILVNPDHASTPIDRSLLSGIFTMRVRQWPGGDAVHVFVLPDNDALSDRFAREKLGTYPYVLRATWDRLVFTGTGLAPTVVRSEQEMRERVRATPGAIGYVRGGEKPGLLQPLQPVQPAMGRSGSAAPARFRSGIRSGTFPMTGGICSC